MRRKSRKVVFSVNQLEVILSKFDLDPRDVLPESAYKKELDLKRQWIEKLSIKIKPEDEGLKVKISGLYVQEYACSYKHSGLWQPGSPSKEKFEYETKLNNLG